MSRGKYRYSKISKKVLPIDEWHKENEQAKPNPAPAGHVYKSGFNHGLGVRCGSKGDERDAINRINDMTGSKLVEVGNERVAPKPVEAKVNKKDMYEYAQHLQDDRP